TAKQIEIKIKGWGRSRRATISRLDSAHGALLPAYESMCRPVSPTPDQLRALRRAGTLGPQETESFTGGRLVVTLPPHGLALIEVRRFRPVPIATADTP